MCLDFNDQLKKLEQMFGVASETDISNGLDEMARMDEGDLEEALETLMADGDEDLEDYNPDDDRLD